LEKCIGERESKWENIKEKLRKIKVRIESKGLKYAKWEIKVKWVLRSKYSQ
jgi:hypothetical protein